MDKILTRGSFITVAIYVLVGIMGYASFADDNDVMKMKNILNAPAYSSRVEC